MALSTTLSAPVWSNTGAASALTPGIGDPVAFE